MMTKVVGFNNGRIIVLMICVRVAPSIEAASNKLLSMPCSPASKIIEQNPIWTHTPTKITAIIPNFGSTSQPGLPPPKASKSELRGPTFRSRTSFQISPTTTGESITGKKIIALKKPLANFCSFTTSASAIARTVESTTQKITQVAVFLATDATVGSPKIAR